MAASSNIVIIPGGDILEAEETIIAHQCNCVTTTGKGLAKVLFDAYPEANVYKNRREHDTPGTNKVIKTGNKTIVNMFAQFKPGKPSGVDNKKTRLMFFESCLNQIDIKAGDRIAMPYLIGCDLAGGNWTNYYSTLSNWAESNDVTVVLYDINNKSI